MSQRALLLAYRDDLRTFLPTSLAAALFPSTSGSGGTLLVNNQVDITFDGRPLPIDAEVFVAIWPTTWSNQYDEGIEEIFGANITVSEKGGKVPLDRWGPELMANAATGLDLCLEVIRARVHSNYVTMNAANTTINTAYGTSNGFVRPLFFRDGGTPQPKGGEWWGGAGKERWAGLAQTLRFDAAQRDQTIESMT